MNRSATAGAVISSLISIAVCGGTAAAAAAPLGPRPAAAHAGCPYLTGKPASRAAADAALTAAAATAHWAGIPGGAPGRAAIVLPFDLIRAIAWQESTWRSTVVGCGGSYGMMQLQIGTAAWVNKRFHTSYSYLGTRDNAQLGAEYLEWLIAYFGALYLHGSYSLVGPSLPEMVISAYNAGPGNVSMAANGTVKIVNPGYVARVQKWWRLKPWTR